MNRDDFSQKVKDNLQKRAAYICSSPDCNKMTVAPADESDDKAVYIGKAAHICAASEGGPRYDSDMSKVERSSISNAIFLCSSCADIIDKNKGLDYPKDTLIQWKMDHENWVRRNLNKKIANDEGAGGDGGDGEIYGDRGVIVGGRAGRGGIGGKGGKGGSGTIHGNDGLIIGGDGGDAAQNDGRGGRGAKGPTEKFGCLTNIWGFGRGGSAPNHPEYDRRIALLKKIRFEYIEKFPSDRIFIEAGIEVVPIDWVNQRLVELNEEWKVEMGNEGYVLPALVT